MGAPVDGPGPLDLYVTEALEAVKSPLLEKEARRRESQYKVAVWATGGVGKYAIRTIADRPNLDLVGVWVHSDNKDGKDAGELAGIDPLGVRATRDAVARSSAAMRTASSTRHRRRPA